MNGKLKKHHAKLWLTTFTLILMVSLFRSDLYGSKSLSNVLRPYLEVQYYNAAVYQNAKSNSKAYAVTGQIAACVLPHHATASILISSFFHSLHPENYDTVVILAPNHKALSGGAVFSNCDWLTPFGRCRSDDELISLISASGNLQAVNDNEVVWADHSASYLLPFVADCLPGKEVAVVLLSRTGTKEQVSALSEILSQYAEKKRVLVLGSVDFSHFLMPVEAAQKDDVTMNMIENGDREAILKLNNFYLDSPQTLACVMGYVEKIGSKLSIVDHSSSDQELKTLQGAINPAEGTTTYLVCAATNK